MMTFFWKLLYERLVDSITADSVLPCSLIPTAGDVRNQCQQLLRCSACAVVVHKQVYALDARRRATAAAT